ncbi:MAG: hypothetical protein HYT15_01535 [Candidatus Magasanikbacteria bacterium]|nr:hypothetical protein [Candidatus Magasanikbacteria bacterium]
MFFDQKNLTDEEIKVKELEFQRLSSDIGAATKLRQELKNYFSFASTEEKEALRWTYWRWYVELTWKNFNSLSKDGVVDAFSKQVPMAIVNSYNILDSLMWYLTFHLYEEAEMQSFYLKVKPAFINSEAVLGKWQGKSILVKEIVSEYYLLQQRRASSMEEAEFLTKLKQIMFPKEFESYILVDKDVGVDNFLAIVELFQEIDQEKIWFLVEMFSDPEKYQENNFKSKEKKQTEENNEEKEGLIKEEITNQAKNVQPLVQFPAKEVSKIPTPQQIKSQIEQEFKKDEKGNFVDIDGVMQKLAELSEKYNDSAIADMLYFDEQSGGFKWNI